MILSNMTMFSTIMKSKYIRDHYLKKHGLIKTTQQFDHLSGRRVFPPNEIHLEIKQMIQSGDPLFVGRFGSIELLVTSKNELDIHYKKQNSLDVLCNNAGFFPNDMELAKRYSNLMIESMRHNDVQGIWYLPFEDYAVKHWLNREALLTEGRFLEPWFSDNPWTQALLGKKVLVIHPFDETIKSQYQSRMKLFQNQDYLPEFDLKIVRAVQTIAGTVDDRFPTWFDALEYMFDEAMKQDFDIALIGCGAYGYPLAAKIKSAGKQAIHMGGVLQAMFGIKGKRWEKDPNPIVRNLYNEYWVRPDQSDIPTENQRVENGCYW